LKLKDFIAKISFADTSQSLNPRSSFNRDCGCHRYSGQTFNVSSAFAYLAEQYIRSA
jgi:hypothetical protein